ncbi:MAG: hypothetical protein M3Z03_13270 [Actinomycetota bacterium]|nr:hypothetical protein [Actinomycetota bacterium]
MKIKFTAWLAATAMVAVGTALVPTAAGAEEPTLVPVEVPPGSTDFAPAPVGDQPVVPAPGLVPSVPPTGNATISTQFTGFSGAAQTAFNHATAILGSYLVSAVPIEVRVSMSDLPGSQLGSAGPALGFADQAGLDLPVDGAVYPIALVNALRGSDLCPTVNTPSFCAINGQARPHDINMQVDSSANWYFGTDGAPGAGQIDFVTVVLHELLHGVGHVTSFQKSGSAGSYGTPPQIYDRYVENVAGNRLTSFANGSTAIGTALTSGLRWGGASGIAGNGGTRPILYAPNTFQSGSSAGHLDEATYTTGPNALMTPVVQSGQAIHAVGSVTQGMLRDIGWSVTDPGPAPTDAYHALSPARICDTRPISSFVPSNQCNDQPGEGALGTGGQRNVQVTGQGGVPSGASAVVLNVTATETSSDSFLTVWPAGGALPNASNLNWRAGQALANLVTVPVSAGGAISIANQLGQAHVIVDVQGYFAPAQPGAGLVNPVTPARICDTRPISSFVPSNQCNDGPGDGSLGQGGQRNIQVTGQGGIPSSGVAAIIANLTVTQPTAASFMTAWPTGQALPNSSNVNWQAGADRANRIIIPVGTGGQISVFNFTGAAHVLLDVSGWITSASSAGAPGSTFSPLPPTRICDSRPSSAFVTTNQCNAGGAGASIGQGLTKTIQVTGQGGVPAGATAVVLNVTSSGSTAQSFFTVYPGGTARPSTSDVNWVSGQDTPNLVVVRLPANGQLTIYNATGNAHVIADVQGYFVDS